MIIHTSDSHKIPSQNKTKSKLQIKKIAKTSNFEIWQQTLHRTDLLGLPDKMYKYEMDPTRTVGTTEWTPNVWQTDEETERRTDRGTDGVKPIYPPPPPPKKKKKKLPCMVDIMMLDWNVNSYDEDDEVDENDGTALT